MQRSYHVEIHQKAAKELDSLQDNIFTKIDKEIRSLCVNPRPFRVKKLDKALHRIRVGDFRVIYAIHDKDKKVIILRIVRRSESTYRDL